MGGAEVFIGVGSDDSWGWEISCVVRVGVVEVLPLPNCSGITVSEALKVDGTCDIWVWDIFCI